MKKATRVLSLTMAAAMAAGVLGGCSSSAQGGTASTADTSSAASTTASSADSGHVIRVGVVCSMTGGSAIYGEGAQNAVDMAVEEIKSGDSGDLSAAGKHFQDRFHTAHLGHLTELAEEVVEVEFILFKFFLKFFRFLFVDLLCGFFDQRNDIAHAENPGRHAVRMKDLQIFHFFADADEFNRASGDFADRKSRSAARIAVQFRQHHAGNAERIVKMLCDRNRLLTERRIRDEQNFRRADRLFEPDKFLHHGSINLQPSGGVDDQIIAITGNRPFDGILRNRADIHISAFGVNRIVSFIQS